MPIPIREAQYQSTNPNREIKRIGRISHRIAHQIRTDANHRDNPIGDSQLYTDRLVAREGAFIVEELRENEVLRRSIQERGEYDLDAALRAEMVDLARGFDGQNVNTDLLTHNELVVFWREFWQHRRRRPHFLVRGEIDASEDEDDEEEEEDSEESEGGDFGDKGEDVGDEKDVMMIVLLGVVELVMCALLLCVGVLLRLLDWGLSFMIELSDRSWIRYRPERVTPRHTPVSTTVSVEQAEMQAEESVMAVENSSLPNMNDEADEQSRVEIRLLVIPVHFQPPPPSHPPSHM